MKPSRLALLTSVALPFLLNGPGSARSVETGVALEPLVVAQADLLPAAQAEVAAARAALEEAQASGGDVAAAQARLDAALSVLAAAEAAARATSQPEPEPEPQPQPEPEPEPAPPPPEPPPAPEPPPEQPPTLEAPPVPEPPPEQPPIPEGPPADLPAPDAPPVDEPAPPPLPSEEPPPDEPQAPSVEEPPPAPGEETPPVETLPAPGQSAAPPPASPDAAPSPADQEESAVESQLEAQGDEEAVQNLRALREKLRDEQARRGDDDDDARRRDDDQEARRDRDRDGDRDRRPRERPPGGDIVFDFGGRFIIRFGDQIVIRQDDAYESDRFLHRARDVDVEHFPGGYTRTTVTRQDGTRIITVRDRYGDIITRTRIDRRGRQVILIDNRDFYRDGRRPAYVRFEDELPPLRIGIPRDRYIVETRRADREAIRAALLAPPVEAVERPYALEEIRMSERLRDKMPRIDLNTITFDFGSAVISPSQFDALAAVGGAMEDILSVSPDEIFLVEGHTDAVGSDADNLVLSDRRAEAIAVTLSSNFAIPPENLVTQGYGEQYLKIPTEGPERENRRVTIRRITVLAHGG